MRGWHGTTECLKPSVTNNECERTPAKTNGVRAVPVKSIGGGPPVLSTILLRIDWSIMKTPEIPLKRPIIAIFLISQSGFVIWKSCSLMSANEITKPKRPKQHAA